MAGILLIGAVAYKQLPVSALPEVDYPTIQVLTFYPGAAPDVITRAFAALEHEGLVSRLTSRTVVIPDAARLMRYGRGRARTNPARG